jgi:hypothetical protein
MARLQDVLYLVSYSGYSSNIQAAVESTKETLTDERLVFPFGIQQTYRDGKTRLQILLEHESFDRVKEIVKMAVNTYHLPILKRVINFKDNDGNTALTASIKTRNIPIVKLLVKIGADINQVNKKGRSPLNLAIACMKEKEPSSESCYCSEPPKGWDLTNSRESLKSKAIVSYLTGLGAIDIPEEVIRYDFMGGRVRRLIFMNPWFNDLVYERSRVVMDLQLLRRHVLTTLLPDAPQAPKPKRMKSSLYKQQFGRR